MYSGAFKNKALLNKTCPGLNRHKFQIKNHGKRIIYF